MEEEVQTQEPIETTQEEVVENQTQENEPTENEQVESKVEESAEENQTKITEFDRIKEAQEQLKTLQSYNKEVEDVSSYEYDEDLEQWVDKNGKLYDEKPKQLKQENTFDPYEWQLKQQENVIQQAKNDLIASKEKECIVEFEKGFGEFKNDLTQAQWEVLKHDVIAPAMEEFSYAIQNDKYDENILKEIKENIKNGIEARISIYNLRSKAQENVNQNKNTNYPLESKAPTGEQGIVDNGTFEGLTRQQRQNKLQSLINKYTHKI